MPRRHRPLSLRARAAVAFGVMGLLASVFITLTTYFAARSYLVDQRQDTAQRQTFANARLARNALRSESVDVPALLSTIGGASGSDVVTRFGDAWFSSSVASGEDTVPLELRQLAADGRAGRQLVRAPDGGLQLVVGTPVAAVDAAYFEIFHLDELDRTLQLLRGVLAAAGVVTVGLAAGFGRFAAGRVVEPLGPVAGAASRIAQGQLDARLPTSRDTDLAELTDAFNAMAAALEERVEREQRFASDVSHELRSPLAAVRAALEVIERRREQLPPGVADAVDILAARTSSFEALVLDLLEISRFDADAIDLHVEDLELETFVRQTVNTFATGAIDLHLPEAAPHLLVADRRRLAHALGNIISNADRYAGGLTDLTVEVTDDCVRFVLDDRGPGIDPAERAAIFARFARGSAGRQAGSSSGTGLGLSLATAQIELHGGRIWVEDRPGGGARFVVEIPLGAAA